VSIRILPGASSDPPIEHIALDEAVLNALVERAGGWEKMLDRLHKIEFGEYIPLWGLEYPPPEPMPGEEDWRR
jgi:hypothetical protein